MNHASHVKASCWRSHGDRKEIDLRFVVGYTPLEFRDTLHMLAGGKVDAAPLVAGTVGLPGVDPVPAGGDR